jgi:hypothetical protein
MLTHPHPDDLRAYVAEELDAAAQRRTTEHVLACTECRGTLQWLEEVRAAAGAEPPAPPPDTWQRIAARVAADEVVLLPLHEDATGGGAQADVASAGTAADDADPGRGAGTAGAEGRGAKRPSPLRRGWRVAAAAVLVAGGVAAAAPDGWLRSLVAAVLGSGSDAGEAPPPAAAAAAEPPAMAPAAVALLVEPANGAVHISLQRPHEAVRVHVRVVDTGDLQVAAHAGSAAATFRTSPGRLEIVGGDSGAVVLTVPLSLGRVQVDVEGRVLLLKERGEIRILAPSADTVGSEFVLPVRTSRAPPR